MSDTEKILQNSDSSDTESRDCTKLTNRKRSVSSKTETVPRKRTKNHDEEHDNKSDSSQISSHHKSSNISSSTPDPASTPDEDRSDLGENGNLEHVTLFWFTEAALRMHDNPGLKAAVKGCKAVSTYYFICPIFKSYPHKCRKNDPV